MLAKFIYCVKQTGNLIHDGKVHEMNSATRWSASGQNVSTTFISTADPTLTSPRFGRKSTSRHSKMALYGMDDDDVVISGISTALPGSPNFADFSKKLLESLSFRGPPNKPLPTGFTGELPNYSQELPNKTKVDMTFFGLSKPVADATSYITRKNYERAYEALYDAGLHRADIQKIMCPTTACSSYADGELLSYSDIYSKNIYRVTGSSRAMEISRIAFVLGTVGSTNALDSGSLGGLQSIQIAYHAIKNNQADMAIVCGGNLTVDPLQSVQMNDLGYLSKDGKVRVFDEEASGYFRSDCSAAFVLQRAKDACRIYAKIDGICVETIPAYPKGASTNYSCDNWDMHLRDFYARTKIPSEKISYLEAYGSGIKAMDTEELNAVTNVFCENRKEPLYVGSVKSNVGFCEGGSDFVSIAKAIVCLESGFIPGNADYSSPNRSVPGLINGNIKVVDKTTPLPENSSIAVSGWSIGSIYGHMVLSPLNKPKAPVEMSIPRLVPLTARTSDYLIKTIHTMETVPYDPEFCAFVTNLFRRKIDKFLGRGYVVLPKKENSVSLSQVDEEQQRPLWFVFSGMGSQWNGMGKGLLELPIARESLQLSHRVLEPHGVDLMNILTSSDPAIFDNILHCFVGISAIQIALVDVMRALKIEPDGIIGHSVGEFGCAYCDGTMTAEQMILCAYYRGRASLEATLIKGFMAAVGKGYAEIKDDLPEGVVVGCHNSSTSCTLSGPAEIVSEYVKKLESEGVFARTVNVANIAYHSPHIKPAIPIILNYLKKMIPNPLPRSEKWISTSVPEEDWDKEFAKYSSAEYHTNNFSSQVLFEEGCRHIPNNAVIVEIAPHGLLQAILKRSMGSKVLNIPLTNRSAKDPLVFLLEGIGKMFAAGFDLDINALYPKFDYPVSRGTLGVQQLMHWALDDVYALQPLNFEKFDISLRKDFHNCDSSKTGYQICGKNLLPLSVYIIAVDKLSTQYIFSSQKKVSTTFTDVRIDLTKLLVEYDDIVEATILLGTNFLDVSTHEGSVIFSGQIKWQYEGDERPEVVPLTSDGHTVVMVLKKDEIYSRFKKAGYIIPVGLQSLTSLSITEQGLIGKIPNTSSIYAVIEGIMQMLIMDAYSVNQKIVLPALIQKLVIYHEVNLESDQPLEVIYDRNMGIVYSSKVFISTVQVKEICTIPSSLTLNTIEIIPFEKPILESSQEFVRFCCDIIQKTKKPGVEIKVLELVDHFPGLKKEIASNIPNAQVSVKEHQEAGTSWKGFDLVVCNSRELNQVASNANGFILAQGHSPITIPADFAQVSEFTSEKSHNYWLLKKKIIMNGERDFILIPDTKEELLQKLQSRRGKSSALIVGFEEPVEGLAQYQEIIESQVNIKLKWLFILDKDYPKFDVMTEFYHEQLKQGLPKNVLINGKWHHVYKAMLQDNLVALASKHMLNGLSNDATGKTPVMGIKAACDHADLDLILSWPVPASWSEEEAKSVPFAYCMAYFCLAVVADVKKFDRVLVTDALSAEGQAALAVVIPRAGRVFASVASNEEALQLQKLFPSIKKEDITFHTEPHMSLKLKLAAGEDSPNIVYNFLDGDVFRSSYENIELFGKIFHFGREQVNRNELLNMSQFLRSVSLYAISRESILQWTDAEKETIKALVSEGIQSGVVKPPVLQSTVNSGQDAAMQPIARSHSIQQRRNKFDVISSGCYVIVGDKSDHDLDIADWLAKKGAKKLIISKPSQKNSLHYEQQVQKMKLRCNVSIDIHDELGMKGAIKNEKIRAIFFVDLVEHGENSGSSLHNDIVTNGVKHIVTITKNQGNVSKPNATSESGTAITNIIWNVDNSMIRPSLDMMLPFFGRSSTISVESEEVTDVKKLTARFLQDYIPNTLDGYHRLGLSLKSLPDFVEIPTLSPCYTDKSPVCPIFVIPGVEDDPVESATALLGNILYPAFVAHIPHNGFVSVPNIASGLIPIMKKIAPRSSVNLVGIAAGAPIAIEIARQLENQGATVAVLIVDNPLQQAQCGMRSIEDLQRTVLNSLSALNPRPLEETLRGKLPWPALLNSHISSMDLPANTDNWIKQATCYVYDRFLAILDYGLQAVEIKGPLTVLRSRDHVNDSNSNKLCSMHKTLDVPISRKALLHSQELGSFVNKFAINEEMLIKCVDWPELEEFLDEQMP